jgi:hypothetical protein
MVEKVYERVYEREDGSLQLTQGFIEDYMSELIDFNYCDYV